LTGFEIAGADGKYVAADATIEGASVVVSNSAVQTPVSVRYGWAANPACNLVNHDGLPASPFQAPE
jgi:sialate O-acetylesterase